LPNESLTQLAGIAAIIAWSGGLTLVLLKLISLFALLRAGKEHEFEGLHLSQHGGSLQ
jgi:Amt family ammonium transporter